MTEFAYTELLGREGKEEGHKRGANQKRVTIKLSVP